MKIVSRNLRRAGIDAVVPVPVPGMVGRRAFAMSFEEGFKVPTTIPHPPVRQAARHAVPPWRVQLCTCARVLPLRIVTVCPRRVLKGQLHLQR